ncbi:hypothetical protein ILYODFUR_011323 [Ilyodon furcidens]|uniref:Uncharacterized protein n=1 Tax=Ilyodon furcidens TaxID=33524 RepID=A0ABV0U4H8_9TELE
MGWTFSGKSSGVVASCRSLLSYAQRMALEFSLHLQADCIPSILLIQHLPQHFQVYVQRSLSPVWRIRTSPSA